MESMGGQRIVSGPAHTCSQRLTENPRPPTAPHQHGTRPGTPRWSMYPEACLALPGPCPRGPLAAETPRKPANSRRCIQRRRRRRTACTARRAPSRPGSRAPWAARPGTEPGRRPRLGSRPRRPGGTCRSRSRGRRAAAAQGPHCPSRGRSSQHYPTGSGLPHRSGRPGAPGPVVQPRLLLFLLGALAYPRPGPVPARGGTSPRYRPHQEAAVAIPDWPRATSISCRCNAARRFPPCLDALPGRPGKPWNC
mmetsp:Transcript_123915/g.350835  ORF Transcript_123915/g.350835 Transcript_123915/m.350835 type:complete len:251 (+) Transcript_123915:152-904(+)